MVMSKTLPASRASSQPTNGSPRSFRRGSKLEKTGIKPSYCRDVLRRLEARKAIEQQVDDLDRKVLKLARCDAEVRRFMTVPGVGPITALCFKATIDDPTRFKRSRSVGAYVGLTTRRFFNDAAATEIYTLSRRDALLL